MKRVLVLVCAALLVVLIPVAALAQKTTGGFAGTIVDSTGARLGKAVVTLSGPSMQGTQTTTTDDVGLFRFRNLPPGTNYKLVAHLKGFQDVTIENLQVFLGQESTLTVTLSPVGVTETVTVSGGTPLVDVTQTTIGINITSAQFIALPGARSFQQLTTLSPGVTLEMGDHDPRYFKSSPTVGAASAPENNYVIDGLSSTDPRFGTSGTNLTMNFVSEVQVLTGGYQAEFGRATGGVFNVVTKSGGNQFRGDVFAYFSNKSWTPADSLRRVNKELQTNADRVSASDIGISFGGPIVKDKIWFFGAIDPNNGTTYIGGQAGASTVTHSYDTKSNVYAGKVTWAPTSTSNLVFSAFGDPSSRDGWLTNPNADESSAIRSEKSGSYNYGGHYTLSIRPTWVLEAAAGRHQQRVDLNPASDIGRNVPRQVDETIGGYEHGGFQRNQADTTTRDAVSVKLTNVWGDHEFRYGWDFERNDYKANLAETWYRYFGSPFEDGTGTYVQERNYSVKGDGTTLSTALFAQDSWRLASNVRLNVGVRYEIQQLNSVNKVAIAGQVDAADCTSSGICRTVNGLTLGDHWAPRIGFTWDPMKNGRSKVYASWGRYFENVPLDMNIRAINGEKYIITQYYNNSTLTSDNWVNPNGSPLAINPGWFVHRLSNLVLTTPLDESLKAQFQDEFVVGADYQFADYWSAGARYVRRNLGRIIEDIGTFTDPTDPLLLTGYVIGNPGEGFFGAPFDKPNRKYDSMELTLQRRLHDRWQLYSSFVYAKAVGNYEGLYMSGYDQLDPNITAQYDIPSFLVNGTGRLRADKPYVFKVHGSYAFDWGLTVAEGVNISAGVPYTKLGPEVVNGYGDGTIFLQPRGSQGRTGAYWTADLQLDYRLPFFGKSSPRQLSVVWNAFNIFGNHKALEVDQDYTYEGMPGFSVWSDPSNLDQFGNPKYNPNLPSSKFYATPILYQAPRTMTLAFRFNF